MPLKPIPKRILKYVLIFALGFLAGWIWVSWDKYQSKRIDLTGQNFWEVLNPLPRKIYPRTPPLDQIIKHL